MTSPTDVGLAEFITISGVSHRVRAELDEFVDFVCGNKHYWRIELDADEHGTQKTIYLPFHGVEQMIWHDQQLTRKRRAKGKKS